MESQKVSHSFGKSVGCLFFVLILVDGLSCRTRRYGQYMEVCVCTSEYCDDPGPTVENVLKSDTTRFLHYESNIAGKRLEARLGNFTDVSDTYSIQVIHVAILDSPKTTTRYKVHPKEQYQEMFGFGGAVTDSVGINLSALDNKTQEVLLRQYFGSEGIGYTFLRIPLGGTDFSTRNYTYADQVPDDLNLLHFALTKEDYIYKIHYTRWAQQMSSNPIKLLTVSWSAPEWMKEARLPLKGYTKLQKKYYQLYANYIVKFLEEYKAQGLEFWGISPQNEPHDGLILYYGYNSMGWFPEEERDWVRQYLGPTLNAKGFRDLKLLMMEDQRSLLQDWTFTELSDPEARKYISGIALHWYADGFPQISPVTRLDQVHYLFPDLFMIYTEASIMHFQGQPAVQLGSWVRGEAYAVSILQTLSHWVVGWLDWNLALDLEGGPTWAGNTLDSPIIVNASAKEFYKQPMFYAIAHFSRFVLPGSRRIKLSKLGNNAHNISSVAFVRPDDYVVVVFINTDNTSSTALLEAEGQGTIKLIVSGRSFHTVIYRSKLNVYQVNTGSRNSIVTFVVVLLMLLTIFCSSASVSYYDTCFQ